MFNLSVILRKTATAMRDHLALAHDGGQMTYRELDELSGRLRRRACRARAASGGDPVVPRLPNIPQFPVAYLGILKAGGASESGGGAAQAGVTDVVTVGSTVDGVPAVPFTDVPVGTVERRPLPPGREHLGELVTRGYHVMKGYHWQPEATAGGWVHTGDSTISMMMATSSSGSARNCHSAVRVRSSSST